MSRPQSQLQILAEKHGIMLTNIWRAFTFVDLQRPGMDERGWYALDKDGRVIFLGDTFDFACATIIRMAQNRKREQASVSEALH